MLTIETLSDELVRTPWMAGPLDGTRKAVIVSVTDFQVAAADDLGPILQAGLELRAAWPIMHGAVGLWLWAKPEERRNGSVSVWERHEDLQRFVRWPTHVAIMRQWRDRGTLGSEVWSAERFVAEEAWARAEQRLNRAHESGRA